MDELCVIPKSGTLGEQSCSEFPNGNAQFQVARLHGGAGGGGKLYSQKQSGAAEAPNPGQK